SQQFRMNVGCARVSPGGVGQIVRAASHRHKVSDCSGRVIRARIGSVGAHSHQQAVGQIERNVCIALHQVGLVNGQVFHSPGGSVAGVVEVGQHVFHQHVSEKKPLVVRHDAPLTMHQLGVGQPVGTARIVGGGVILDGGLGMGDAHVAQIGVEVVADVKVQGDASGKIGGRIAGTASN